MKVKKIKTNLKAFFENSPRIFHSKARWPQNTSMTIILKYVVHVYFSGGIQLKKHGALPMYSLYSYILIFYITIRQTLSKSMETFRRALESDILRQPIILKTNA